MAADEQWRSAPGSMAEVAERLHRRFAPELPLAAAIILVRHCRRELEISSGPATPALVEELALRRYQGLDRTIGSNRLSRS